MIEFNKVKKVYPNGTVALEDISFQVGDGEFVFIVGASGAGKSTIAKLLLREERVTSGHLIVDEMHLDNMPDRVVPYYRRKIGMVFQDFRLFPNKTVYENVAFAMQVVGEPAKNIRRRVPSLLEVVGLEDKLKDFPGELAGGEQQRVALARAIANNPNMIIADEPTGNIDPQRSMEIMNLLVKINTVHKKTVLVVTHEKTLVDYFKKRVITISDGHVVGDHIGGMFQ